MANPDRPNPEAKLQIGEMPKPRYMREAQNTAEDSKSTSKKWIGMEAYSLDGEIKEFHWWRNFEVGDLSREQPRYDAAAFVARLKLEKGVDSAIGLPVDLSKSNSATGHVEVMTDEPGVYGVYLRGVEADKRPLFNFMAIMNGIESEAQLRRAKPVEFDAIFQKARAVLPQPLENNTPKSPQSSQEVELDPRIEFITGDITEVEAEAIVCPSLPELGDFYTGVVGAIMRKGGDRIFAEARAIGKKAKRENPDSEYPVPLYSAHLTNGGDLPKAKHVIHSVAVDFTEDQGFSCNPEVIFESAWNVLDVAGRNRLTSVAFPALGSGWYRVPIEQSFRAIAQAANKFLQEHPDTSLERVKLVSFDPNLPPPTLVEEVDQWLRSLRTRRN